MDTYQQEFQEEQPLTGFMRFLLISLIIFQVIGLIFDLFSLVKSIQTPNPITGEFSVILNVMTCIGRVLAIWGGALMLSKRSFKGLYLYLGSKLFTSVIPIVVNLSMIDKMVELVIAALLSQGKDPFSIPLKGILITTFISILVFKLIWPILIWTRRTELR